MKIRLSCSICAVMLLSVPWAALAVPPTDLPDAAPAWVTVAASGAGTVVSDPPGIVCPGACTATFPPGLRVSLLALPEPDGVFLTYTGDCAGTQPSCEILVSHSRRVNAYFSGLQADAPAPEPGSPPAPVPRTGQTACYGTGTGVYWQDNQIDCAGTGQDGEHQKGEPPPEPRFTDRNDGTVMDNLTGLVWLKDADCFGGATWLSGLALSDGLADGTCGLSDGSQPGDWRLPNIKEFLSLISYESPDPALSGALSVALPAGHPFSNADNSSDWYWTSTTLVRDFASHNAYVVTLDQGGVLLFGKNSFLHVWPVRDAP